ncbi:MAG TPA: HAMP domain-containing sensor histidine kinase [Longimicrobiales bacterium]|nr:HAMP domain-containing sensor histidine kinase [Longimicrobiales bacterium]
MNWRLRVQRYTLRTKVLVTIVGAAVALLGISTHLSFRYWRTEAVAAAEQQALLAAASARTAVESGLQSGRTEYARRALQQLLRHEPVVGVRVYATDGSVLIAPDVTEEGRRPTGVWIPSPRELRQDGVVRHDPATDVVRAFVPVTVPPAAVIEVEYSLGPVQAAMDRGARLGLGLVVGTVFALAAILFTMLEREVVAPLTRISDLMSTDSQDGRRTDEVGRLEAGVTELLEREHLAAAQREQYAQQAGFAQVGELAAEMAHEFKRPLTSIQSAVRLLAQEYVLEERGQLLLGAVEDQLGHLSETMRDLFMLAKPVGLELEPVSLRDVMDAALAQLAGHPAAQGLNVRREYPDTELVVRGDARRLEQAAANLMLNAAEAMTGGGELTLRMGAADGFAWLEVADNGAGIPEAEVEKVLLPFYSTKPAGTGLGLPLVARVVAAHQGRIAIESVVGTGTRVRVELPLAEGATDARAAHGSPKEATWRTRES